MRRAWEVGIRLSTSSITDSASGQPRGLRGPPSACCVAVGPQWVYPGCSTPIVGRLTTLLSQMPAFPVTKHPLPLLPHQREVPLSPADMYGSHAPSWSVATERHGFRAPGDASNKPGDAGCVASPLGGPLL